MLESSPEGSTFAAMLVDSPTEHPTASQEVVIEDAQGRITSLHEALPYSVNSQVVFSQPSNASLSYDRQWPSFRLVILRTLHSSSEVSALATLDLLAD